jgi:hypothetical protein
VRLPLGPSARNSIEITHLLAAGRVRPRRSMIMIGIMPAAGVAAVAGPSCVSARSQLERE